MKNANIYLLALALAAIASLLVAVKSCQVANDEVARLGNNQTALLDSVKHYKTKAGKDAASVQALTLRIHEYEKLVPRQAAEIKALGIKLKRVETVAHTGTQMTVDASSPLRDTTIYAAAGVGRKGASETGVGADSCPDLLDGAQMSAKTFDWSNPWTRAKGVIIGDSVHLRIESSDTLLQVVYRVPYKFLFFRFGTKAIRQEVVLSDPNARITYTEYIRLVK